MSFYTLGTLLLPMGDFSGLQDLPEMYSHCKATEDKDMTVIDFVTDHLLNIDGIFDQHNNGDHQKPHAPIKPWHINHEFVYLKIDNISIYHKISFQQKLKVNLPYFIWCYTSEFYTSIFHPPILFISFRIEPTGLAV